MEYKEFYKEKLLSNVIIQPSPDGRYQDCWIRKRKYITNANSGFYVLGRGHGGHRVSAWIYGLVDQDGNEFTLNSKYHVLHKCDNPPCFNPDHLFVGTAKHNAEDRDRKERSNIIHSKLTKLKDLEKRIVNLEYHTNLHNRGE